MTAPLKIRKSVIKNIIKECLVEILSEGLNANTKNINENVVLIDDTQEQNTVSQKNKILGQSSSGFLKNFMGPLPQQQNAQRPLQQQKKQVSVPQNTKPQ